MNRSPALRLASSALALALVGCDGSQDVPDVLTADGALATDATDVAAADAPTDIQAQSDTLAPPPDGAMPPPPDGAMPPPPDGAMPPPPDGAMPPPPDGAMPPRDVPPIDSAVDASTCSSTGTVTLATPPTVQSATSNYNVTLLACTRTAAALQCALGVAHNYTETIDGALRRIRANGIPNHDVGAFPNPGNPNSIGAQVYAFAVPVTPSGAGAAARVFGVTTAGVVLDPGTAERWNDSTSWSYEALRYGTAPTYFSGSAATDRTFHPSALGLDCNFAHVQPNGAYHYHGIPTGLMPTTPALTFVGWAGDGYPIYARYDRANPADPTSAITEMRASYRLRSGTRPSGTAGPGGTYDGTFVQDWEYAAGTGDLDECNGRTGTVPLEGRAVNTYHYVLTNTYPYIPRCFHATPDPSFTAMPPAMGGDAGVPLGDGGMMPPPDGAMPPPDAATGPRACTTTADCTGACPPGSRGCSCSTTPMGQRCTPTCTTTADCPMAPAGITFTCRMGICAP